MKPLFPKPAKKQKKPKKALSPSEYDECKAFVEYLDIQQRMGKVLLYTHIPNETFTKSWMVKAKNRIMGVRKGFPDYVVITYKNAYFIEMKRIKDSQTSPEQKEWITWLNKMGLNAKVCKGADEAIEFINVVG